MSLLLSWFTKKVVNSMGLKFLQIIISKQQNYIALAHWNYNSLRIKGHWKTSTSSPKDPSQIWKIVYISVAILKNGSFSLNFLSVTKICFWIFNLYGKSVLFGIRVLQAKSGLQMGSIFASPHYIYQMVVEISGPVSVPNQNQITPKGLLFKNNQLLGIKGVLYKLQTAKLWSTSNYDMQISPISSVILQFLPCFYWFSTVCAFFLAHF